jgi:hypothetical protein
MFFSLCDFSNYFNVRNYKDAAFLAAFLTALFCSLQFPHSVYVYSPRAYTIFAYNGLHKFLFMWVMTTAMQYLKNTKF